MARPAKLIPKSRSRDLLLTGCLAAVLGWSAPVHAAEVSAEHKAAARDLALEGIRLAEDGKCDQALGPLSRAHALFEAPTILGWVGRCQIELGRLVQGTETLNQVVRLPLQEGAPPAYLEAQKEAKRLLAATKPKIAKLTITVKGADGSLNEETTVEIDGKPVASALIGVPRPTDPGKHVIEVSAPGYESSTLDVTLKEGEKRTMTVELVLDTAAAMPPTSTQNEPAAASDQTAAPARNDAYKYWGWGFSGTGALLMIGGGVSGALALSSKGKLECQDKVCPPEEEDQLQTARTQAAVSTVLFGVGGAALVAGVVVLVTGRQTTDPEMGKTPEWTLGRMRARPLVGLGSLGVSGEF